MTVGWATLTGRMTSDGLCEMSPGGVVGKAYLVDLDSVREVRLFNKEWHVMHEKVIIDTLHCHECGAPAGWLPCELLQIQARH